MEHGKAEKLRQKILNDAEAEARKIIEEAEAEARGIREEATAQADGITSDYKAKARAGADEHIRRQLSLRELEARKAILAEKRAVIEEVFDKALEINPKMQDAMIFKGMALCLLGRYDEAMDIESFSMEFMEKFKHELSRREQSD